nr:hypothetical protein [Tanacetum cinerariifolium]
MSIKDVMLNEEIMKSKAYQTYLPFSTGVVIPKKARKGSKALVTPKKTSSITTEEDIILDPKEAKRRPTGVIMRDTPNVSKKKTQDQSLKLKEFPDEAKGISTSTKEGACVTLEVPDVSKAKSAVQDINWGSDEDEIILSSSDDERTKFENETTKSDKTDEELDYDKGMHDDEEEHIYDETKEDEYVHDDAEKHDDVDEEMYDVENADKVKDDQVMSETEKGVFEKTKEKKVKDDQVRALAFVTQKKNIEAPPSSFSLSLSLNYGNKFLNLSPDGSLVGIVKETIDAEINSIVMNQRPKLLLKAVSDFIGPKTKSTIPDVFQKDPVNIQQHDLQKDALDISKIKLEHASKQKESKQSATKVNQAEFRQKEILFKMMRESKMKKRKKSEDTKPSKRIDQSSLSKGTTQSQPTSTSKSVQAKETVYKAADTNQPLDHENDIVNDDDQIDFEVAPKTKNSIWFKQPRRPKTPDLEWNQDKAIDVGSKQTWLQDLIDKLTKANLVGPIYKLLKGTCKSSIELEYNMDQRYNALTDKLDWTNPKGDKPLYDLSKPLPLQGSPGYLTIHVNFFFNNDLEYLKIKNSKRKYTMSITKTKAARCELKFIEEMIPRQWSLVNVAYNRNVKLGICHWGPKHQLFYKSQINKISKHDVYSTMKILSVVSVKVDKRCGYGYLEEIIVIRAYQKLYTLKEGDLPRLHLNDIEDMLLLYFQNKLFNLEGDDVVDLAVALHMSCHQEKG